MRRLLRNRASAQQARERKKHFMNGIEGRAKELDDCVLSLESRVSVLERENATLRALIKTATPSCAAPAKEAKEAAVEEEEEEEEEDLLEDAPQLVPQLRCEVA